MLYPDAAFGAAEGAAVQAAGVAAARQPDPEQRPHPRDHAGRLLSPVADRLLRHVVKAFPVI
ncbi:hypothetical protein [Cupriavidus gilardii]|uniref:hypothetical protein n=1 Tax=Cupriavidus gilardii TaxID=82541 RepID=UPI0021DB1056